MADRWRGPRVSGTAGTAGRVLLVLGFIGALGIGGCAYALSQMHLDTFSFKGLEGLECIAPPTTLSVFDPTVMNRTDAVWSAALPDQPSAAPAVFGRQVFVRTRDGSLSAFDIASGAKHWSISLGGRPLLGFDFAPVVDNDTLFVTGWDGGTRAIDTATGTVRWNATPPEFATTTSRRGGNAAIEAAPSAGAPIAASGNDVFVDRNQLVALDRVTGTIRWSAPVGNSGLSGYSTPAVTPTLVIVGSGTGAVRAFDRATGAGVWSTAPVRSGEPFGAGPNIATAASVIVVTDRRDESASALDTQTGTTRWTTGIGRANTFGSLPTIVGNTAIVRSVGLRAIDLTSGTPVWNRSIGGTSDLDFMPIPIQGNTAYVVGGDGLLHAIALDRGSEIWTAGRRGHSKCKNYAGLPPAFGEQVMVLASGDRHIYAYPR